jgi:hypothetical protein
MGLFFPVFGIEQARFLRLTTCKTIVADHMSEFGGGAGMFGWLFFDYAVQILAPTGGYIDKQKSACYNKF